MKTIELIPSHWLFLSISSVSTEQQQIYAKNCPETLEVQENMLKMRNGSQWWYRPNFLMQTPSLRLDMSAQGNLLRELRAEIRRTSEDQKLTKLCSDAGFLKDIGKGQFFITFDEERPDDINSLCREYCYSDESMRIRMERISSQES